MTRNSPKSVALSNNDKMPMRPVHNPEGMRIKSPITKSATAPAVQRAAFAVSFGGSGCDKVLLAELHVKAIAVEEIVRVEGNDLSL